MKLWLRFSAWLFGDICEDILVFCYSPKHLWLSLKGRKVIYYADSFDFKNMLSWVLSSLACAIQRRPYMCCVVVCFIYEYIKVIYSAETLADKKWILVAKNIQVLLIFLINKWFEKIYSLCPIKKTNINYILDSGNLTVLRLQKN